MTTRRLAAILAADVVGFSSMMEKDEEGTLRRVKELQREVIEPKVKERGGRLVKTTGDGFLCEFGSPVEAVRCALDVQNATKANGTSDLILRIGINLGDIIVEPDGDIYGDGVNVAARLEQLAEPGGIYVSDDVHRHVAGKIDRQFEDRGEQQVKNIARPVRVYALAGAAQKVSEPRPLALPDKLSIAVLPFTNMSGDPEQEYFGDGVVEDILTALSRFQGLFVIARNSSFTYKGKAVDVRQVGRELGVRYVLEGSVRKAAGRVRITAQLIETASGKHLWADRFDGALTDIFDLQDDITSSVVAAIGSRLEEAEIERSTQKTTDNLDAYDHLLRGKASAAQGTKAAHAEALDLFYRAIDLDPNYALAYACAAWSYGHRKAHRWMVDSEVEIGEADRLARIAVKLGKNDSRALALAGWALAYVVQDLHAGTALTDRAIDLNANLAANWLYGAWVSIWRGEPEQAVQRLGRAMRLSPLEPQKYGFLSALAHAQFQLNQFEQAAANAEKALAEQPSFAPAARLAAAAYGMSDRRSHVIEAVLRLRALDPSLRISNLKDAVGPYVPEQRAQYEEGLRKAGLPE